MTAFRIGFRIPDGVEVLSELQHTFLSGLTQKSGKTTALEGFVSRLPPELSVLIFRTGRGDIPFAGAARIPPFFRERVDWAYVEGLLGAELHQRMNYYRADIINAVRGARTLDQVHTNVRKRLEKVKNPWAQKALVELDQYFQDVLPELRAHRFAATMELRPGAQIVDLEHWRPSTQQLVIASMVDRVMAEDRNVLIVLPEAKDFIPEEMRTPAKLAIESLVRKGAKLGNFCWLDSQYLTSLDLDVLRNFGLWLFGRQTLDAELRRVAKMIPGPKKTWADIQGLQLGQFFVVEGETVTRTYAQPAWLPAQDAQKVARGGLPIADALRQFKPTLKEEPKVNEEEAEELQAKIEGLTGNVERLNARNAELERQLKEANRPAEANARAAAANAAEKIERVPGARAPFTGADESGRPLFTDPVTRTDARTRADVHVFTETPDLTVHVRVVRRDASTEEPGGRAAYLVATGFFDQRRTINEACSEFRARGWGEWKGGSGWNNMDRILNKLASEGFLRNVDKGYLVVSEAKDRIRVQKEDA